MAEITGHQVSNIVDKGLTVSWISQKAEQAQVNYGTSPTALNLRAYDDRGEATQDYTHHVTIINLFANTTYYYEIISGGTTYNDGGEPFEVTIGPTLDFVMPNEFIGGKVYWLDGATPASGAIVYARLSDSQVLSALVAGTGDWGIDLTPVRTGNLQEYYAHSGNDDILLEARGALGTVATRTVPVTTAITGAPEMVVTSGLGKVNVTVSVNLEGKPAPPHESWMIPVSIWVHEAGSPWIPQDTGKHGALVYLDTVTTTSGEASFSLNPGTYDIRLRGATSLINTAEDVTVSEGMATIDMGALILGDTNGDNAVNEEDYLSVMLYFGSPVSTPDALPAAKNCDFDNDGYITALDYSTMLKNIGRSGIE